MLTLQERMQEAMRRYPDLTQADIARACKVKTPSVADWLNGETKSLKPEPARLAALLFGCDQNWIGQGVGMPEWRTRAAQSPESGPSFGGAQSGGTLAEELSRIRPTMDPATIEWGDTLHAKLPPRFILALPDDALAPDFPAGTRISWSTEKPPRVGSVVLVRRLTRPLPAGRPAPPHTSPPSAGFFAPRSRGVGTLWQ